ncbi:MAG: F0F1 ATP synthase subunit delta [Hyphomicrobiaceae bacterium]|nr:F0F1 ATP synthase subunit delta [Hyphomicrobiaceae bacterium]
MANDEPMTASVAGRYASALLDLAQDQKTVATVEADLDTFDAMLQSSPDLKAFVRSPVLSADDQVRALSAVLARAGIGGTAANFLQLVARNRRLFVVGDMIKTFRALAARARGETAVEVTSAVAMSDAQMAALKTELRLIAGKDVVVTPKVDPSILGGLIVKIGSRMIDSSIKTKLTSLGAVLKAGT